MRDHLDIMKELVLRDRESRIELIKTYTKDYNVICLKANVCGPYKNPNYGHIVIKYFEHKIDKLIVDYDLGFIKKISNVSLDGNYFLYLFGKEMHLKDVMVKLEDKEEIGRLVDIDVYEDSGKSISRGTLRKCLICEKHAFVCQKEQNHTLKEIEDKAKDIVLNKLKDIVRKACKHSMMLELDLHPKFGLVTKKTSGSHKDMNYGLLEKTQDVIIPYLVDMFEIGYTNSIKDIYSKIKKIGLKADEKMLEFTKGVNVYKGVIFSLGIICAAFGYKMNNLVMKSHSILNISKDISKSVMNEYTLHDTFGSKAYKEHMIGGARLEAHSGFPNVKEAALMINNFDNDTLLKALVHLIINLEDTVLLKRAKNLDKYYDIKLEFSNLDINNIDDVNKLDKKMIDQNISFGGCADILICALFIKIIQKSFNLKI